MRDSCKLLMLFGINLPFGRLSQYEGQVGYALLTRAPVVSQEQAPSRPLDLHVLSLQLAFILSQDQTLRCKLYLQCPKASTNQIVCTGRKYNCMSDYLTVRIFVPYFTFNLQFQKETKDTLYCLSVWNVVKDHLACQVAQPRCFPKASAKVQLFSEPANKWRSFFTKKARKI